MIFYKRMNFINLNKINYYLIKKLINNFIMIFPLYLINILTISNNFILLINWLNILNYKFIMKKY